MFIVIFYAIPALWLGFLMALWGREVLAQTLIHFPPALISFFIQWPGLLFAAGVLLSLVGHVTTQMEVLYNKNVRWNSDAMMVYAGAALILLASLLAPDWPTLLILFLVTLFLGMQCGVWIFRLMVRWTRTAAGSLLILLGYTAVMLTISWISWQYFLG